MTLRRIVLATGNAGKLREFSALLAPAGQAIAHVNDIILLYVGYSAIHWVCKSPNSPVADMVWRKCLRGRSRRKGRLSCA